MDKVIIKNMVFSGYHGCEDYEKTNQQPFNIDIEIKLDLTNPMKSDKLETTVNYSSVYDLVREIVEENSFNLIEKLASEIIDGINSNFSVDSVKILIKKPKAPMSGKFDYVAVEIERLFNE